MSSRPNSVAGGVGEADSERTEPEVSVCVAHTIDAATCDGTVGVPPTEICAGGVEAADSEHTEPEVSVCATHTVDAAACDGTVDVQPTEILS